MQRVPVHCTMKISRPFRGIEGSGGLPVSQPYGSRCLHVSRHTCLPPRLLAVGWIWGEAFFSFFLGTWFFFFPLFCTLPPVHRIETQFRFCCALSFGQMAPNLPPYFSR